MQSCDSLAFSMMQSITQKPDSNLHILMLPTIEWIICDSLRLVGCPLATTFLACLWLQAENRDTLSSDKHKYVTLSTSGGVLAPADYISRPPKHSKDLPNSLGSDKRLETTVNSLLLRKVDHNLCLLGSAFIGCRR